MYRILVALLAALDAAVAAVTGLAIALIPLSLLWIFGIGALDWSALWPAAASIFQLGHLVPIGIALPADYLGVTGIDPAGASFTLSLAPLAFAVVTALLAVGSARRAVDAGAWVTGVAAGTAAFAAAAAVIALTTATPITSAVLWQAIVLPTAVFAVPAALAALVTAWRRGDDGIVDRLRVRVDSLPTAWLDVPDAILRGVVGAIAGLLAAGALALAVALVVGGGQVIGLFQAANVDIWGATALALAQIAYLPVLVIWGLAFVAGPGFALGADGFVSPAGSQLGVVPGIPILGIVPETTSPWLLAAAVLPIGAGVLAGWIARSVLHTPRAPDTFLRRADDAVAPRVAVAGGIAAGTAGVAALLAMLASGSIGPGRLAVVGPEPGPVALAVGLEVLLGAAIALFAPRRDTEQSPTGRR